MKITSLPHPLASIATITLAILSLLVISGCHDVVDPSTEFTGVQMTFENGAMGGTIGDASDDWKDIPEIGVMIGAAFPNPTTSTAQVAVSLPQPDHVRLWLESAPGKLEETITDADLEAGEFTWEVDMTHKAARIYRVYLAVTHNGKEYTTYGDIKKE